MKTKDELIQLLEKNYPPIAISGWWADLIALIPDNQFKPSSEQPEKKWPTDKEIENAIKKHFRYDGIFTNGTDYECSDSLDDMRKGAKWGIEFIKQYQSKW